jgi:pilus assembly protein CpaB
MPTRFASTMALSAVFATLVALIFYRFAGGAAAAGSAPQLTPIVCATTSLAVGAKIRPGDLKLVSVPMTLRPRDSFSRMEDVVERSVIAPVVQDEPVLKQRISEPGSGLGLAPMIPTGYRAVSVRVNDVIGVAGYAQPGMHVDVLVTGRPPDSADTVTRTVLQNVLILSAGQVLQPEPKGLAINATLVTLQVTPREAEVLTLANDGGHIQLVLRNSTDSAFQASSGTQLSSVYGSSPQPAATHPLPATHPQSPPKAVAEKVEPVPSADRHGTVEIIRGSHRFEESSATPAQTNEASADRSKR